MSGRHSNKLPCLSERIINTSRKRVAGGRSFHASKLIVSTKIFILTSKMKLKVHAQRKFAQGAFIPPSASASALERRVDVTSKDENMNIYYNRMSAVSLLDVVAFQNMHTHTEPVVLLQRLEERQEPALQPAAEVNGTHHTQPKNGTAAAAATASAPNLAKSKPVRPLRYMRPKRTGTLNQKAQRPQRLHLITLLGSSFKPKPRAVKKKCRKAPSVAVRALRRRRAPSTAESCDLDDDKPLTYIAQVLRRSVALRSDRGMRKRRGEELASTSKRRARVPIPTRQQKPTKPRVPAAPPKASLWSDSEDSDDGSHSAPKLRQSTSNSSYAFRVNEGAGTSKQPDRPRRVLGIRRTSQLTDAGRANTSSPRSVASSDGPTRKTTPSGTPRVPPSTKKDDLHPKRSLLTRQMSESKIHKLNKVKKTRSYLHNKIIFKHKAGSRTQQRIHKDLNLRGSRLPPTARGNDQELRASSAKPSVLKNQHNVRSTSRPQLAISTKNCDSNAGSTDTQPTKHNEIVSKGQAGRSNDHKLRSSSRAQPANNEHEPKRLRAHEVLQNSNSDLKTSAQMSQNNGLKLRSSARCQTLTQNNDLKLNNSSQGHSTSQSNDLDLGDSQQGQSTSQSNDLDLGDSQQGASTSQSNDLDLRDSQQGASTSQSSDSDSNSTLAQLATQNNSTYIKKSAQFEPMSQNNDLRSNSRAHSKMKTNHQRSATRILLASKNNPYYLKNSASRYPNWRQNGNLSLGSHRAESTSNFNNPEVSSSSQTQPLAQTPDVGSGFTSGTQILNASNSVSSSSQVQPLVQLSDADIRRILDTPSTSRNNDLTDLNTALGLPAIHNNDLNLPSESPSTSRNNDLNHLTTTLGLPVIHNNDFNLASSSHSPSTSQSDLAVSNSIQVLTNQNNVNPQNTTQAQSTGLNNDLRNSGDPPTTQSNDIRETPRVQPAILNNTAPRTTIRIDDVELRRNLRAQLLMHDLDLRVNSRPLSAIQNYDWAFSGSRNPPRFHNNFLGLERDFRALNAARNGNNQQRTNSRTTLTTRNDLGLDSLRILSPARNSDVEPRTQARSLLLNEHEPSTSTPRPSTQIRDLLLGTTARAPTVQNASVSTTPSARPIRNVDHGFGSNTRPWATGWATRPSFRHGTHDHRVRSTLLNDEIRPRPRPRPSHTGDDLRVPIQPVRDQARYWNLDSGVERTREQQLRAESLAVINRAARAERMAATAAARERAMTLDEALRECVLTAQTVTAEEVQQDEEKKEEDNNNAPDMKDEMTGMQRRQAIAARQQQLAEGSPLSRRNVTSRVTHTETGASATPRVPERKLTASPRLPEPELDPEPGLSNLRRKRQTSTPSDPGRSSFTRSSSSESEPLKEPQLEPELSKLRKKKSTSPELSTSIHTRLLEKESEPETKSESQLQTNPEPEPGPSKVRRTKSTSSPGDAGLSRSLDVGSEPQPGPSKPRLKKTPTLIGGFTHRPRHTPERQTVCLEEEEEESAQFKVPRIPVARKSTERRSKSQGSEQDDTQTPHENVTPPKGPDEEEPTNPNKVFTACPKIEKLPFPSRENLAEPIIRPKNACLSKHLTTVRSIVHATETELADRCGHCIYCTRVDKIRKISSFVQNQRKPATPTNEVYDFDADKEDSHENTRLYNFRQNRKAKVLEPPKDAPKDPVYLDVLPPQNSHIIEITSVPMPNQNKPMLRARLIRKTDANLENEFSLIEHENLLDQLLEIKIANSDQSAKKTPVETEEAVAGSSNTEPSPEVNESGEDEMSVSKTNLSEFLARLQTKLDARRNADQTSARAKTEKPSLQKKNQKEVKKSELVKKAKGPKMNQDETTHVEPPKSSLNDHNLSSCFREAPVFHPTEEEFMDPLAYIEKIYPIASQFGLCKVVAPPGFKPKCTITDDVRFNVANQYISRLYCRWGAASKEMCAIKAYLAEQKVFFTRPPLIEGIELNLPKLYRTVQRHGGLKKVIEKKRWGRVAEDMRFPRGRRSAKRIDQLYVKHLLPYDTLSSAERRELMATVENSWNRNYKKMLSRASNPLHRQKRLMGESESSEEVSDEDANLAYALAEAEDCVVTGRCMKVSVFKKVASNLMCTLFPNSEQPSPKEVEQEYWTLVSGAAEHVCVNAASIDTGEEGYGFPRAKHDPYSKHPWNLKMFSQNDGNVLRSLGPVLGVTVPTLHLGMVFATSCWHRDPHGLPWVEYMHHGPPKIWYGIPDELSSEFRKAVETLCPTSCQNKSIWLPSDITMIPPHLLREAKVPLSRTEQSPGEFVLVCPKAYSSSIATGYTESESVYFAPTQWLADVSDVFQELRDSCEPTMFSLSQLLLAVARDSRTPAHVLAGVYVNLRDIVYAELSRRDALERCGVEISAPERSRASCGQARKKPAGAWNVREQDECEVCRTTLYLSKVTGLTSKRSSLCLEHALLLIEKDKKRDVSGVVATIFVLRAELENAVRRVELRLKE